MTNQYHGFHCFYFLLQACVCDDVLYCRDIYIFVCRDGCLGHREMENEQVEVELLSPDEYCFSQWI